MSSKQYTIRAVPPKVDKALRQQARKTGKSLNTVALDALAKGVGADVKATYNDLDWFIGQRTLDDDFHRAIGWLDEAPQEMT